MSRSLLLITFCLALGIANANAACNDPNDTFESYNEVADTENDKPSEFYVLSYSWSPGYCKQRDPQDKSPGKRDYLQCGSGRNFGYVLHGLWPQGTLANPNAFPRACEGDQPKIDREVLEKYLCMSPSVWLLQHEYENHGTCMIDENLRTPEAYFDKAMELHRSLNLPSEQVTNQAQGKVWFTENNPSLTKDSVYFDNQKKEWRVCYDRNFSPLACPGSHGGSSGSGSTGTTGNTGNNGNTQACKIKGNISGSKRKLYFLQSHPAYKGVVIDFSKGERCFDTVKQAKAAGWKKAP